MLRTRTFLTALVAGLLAAVSAAPAQAVTQQFAGVLEDGRLVVFTSESAGSSTTPVRPRGLQANERLVALNAVPNGTLYGLSSAARLYTVDLRLGAVASATGGRDVLEGLRGARFSLAVAPDQSRARILSDVGQDVTVDLRAGVSSPGPGIRTQDGTALQPAAAMQPDGRLVGVDLLRNVVVREVDPGSGVVTTTPLAIDRRRLPSSLTEPSTFTLGNDGRGFLGGVLSDRQRIRQSLAVSIDLARGAGAPLVTPFPRRVEAFAATRLVPNDRTAPRVRVRTPRTLSARALLASRDLPVTVRTSEGGQVVYSLRIGSRRAGFSFASRNTPGVFRATPLFVAGRDRGILRRAIGRRITLAITVDDDANNSRTILRRVRLVR